MSKSPNGQTTGDAKVPIDVAATTIDLTHTRQGCVPTTLVGMRLLKSLCLRWNLIKVGVSARHQYAHILRMQNITNLHTLTALTYLDLYDNQVRTRSHACTHTD
jgi:hypothetical protein